MTDNYTETRAAAKRAPVVLAQLLILLALIAVFLYYFGQVNLLSCQRNDSGLVDCTTQQKLLGFITLKEKSISDLSAATVDEDCKGTNCRYRIMLYSNLGASIPVTEDYTPGQIVKNKVADQLNTFIGQPNRITFEMREPLDFYIWMVPLLVIAGFAIYQVSMGRNRTSQLD